MNMDRLLESVKKARWHKEERTPEDNLKSLGVRDIIKV